MLHEQRQLLPTRQRIGDRLARNRLRQDRSRRLHLQQQRMQLRQDGGRTFLPQRMTIILRQILFARLAIDSKQAIHEHDNAFQRWVGCCGLGLHFEGVDKLSPRVCLILSSG